MRFRDLRFPCDLELVAACAGDLRRVLLRNVSVTGARIEGLGHVPRGAPLILFLLEGRHAAVVVWVNERQAGLRFAPELTRAQVSALRGVHGADRPGAWGVQGPASHGLREL
jgi:hypothetical protein